MWKASTSAMQTTRCSRLIPKHSEYIFELQPVSMQQFPAAPEILKLSQWVVQKSANTNTKIQKKYIFELQPVSMQQFPAALEILKLSLWVVQKSTNTNTKIQKFKYIFELQPV